MAEENKTEPKVLDAKKEVKLEDIKYNEENQVKALLACVPIIGLVLIFIEKEDQYVRYVGAQAALLMLVNLIPCIGQILFVVGIVILFIKVLGKEIPDLPLVGNLALTVINAF